MQKILFYALTICLIFAACSKTEPPSGFNDPVFIVTYLNQDTGSTTITAGLNGNYHFTNIVQNDDYYTSINTFADVNCPAGDCPGSLSFEFRRDSAVDAALSEGFLEYTKPDSLQMIPIGYLTLFAWDDIFQNLPEQFFQLIDTDTTQLFSPQQSASFTLPDTPHSIILIGFSSSGFYGITYQRFLPSNLAAYPAVIIKASPDGNGISLTALQNLSGSTVTNYLWNTGDTTAMIIRDSTQILQPYSVTVSDSEGKTASATLADLHFPLNADIRNTNIRIESTPILDNLTLGTVAIQWVDPNGRTWRSDRNKQPEIESVFELLSVEPYEVNEHGNPTQKLTVAFKCKLYSELGEAIWFEGEGVIAMAEP